MDFDVQLYCVVEASMQRFIEDRAEYNFFLMCDRDVHTERIFGTLCRKYVCGF